MKIILTKADIESLIKDTYQGVKSIEMIKDEFVIELNSNILKHQTIQPQVIPIKPPMTLEEKNIQEAKQGVMASGGKERVMQRF